MTEDLTTEPRSWAGVPVALAVDTTGRTASLCLLDTEKLWELHRVDPAGGRNARTLVPDAVALCERHGLTPGDVGLVCVALGPGSFTGLRVGVTFAKTLAFANGCDAVGVPSHLCVRRVVRRSGPEERAVRVVSDALRGDRYETAVTLTDPGVPPVADGPRLLRGGPGSGGDDVVRYGEDPGGMADASTVLWAGVERWRAGRTDDPFTLAPLYVRRSSAEEKADENSAGDAGG